MSTSTPTINLVKPAKPEQYNLDVVNNNSDAIDAAFAADRTANGKLAKGLVNQAIGTSTSGGITTTLTIISNIATFTFKANRNYLIVWDGHISSTVDGDVADLSINTCAVADSASLNTGLTVKRQKTRKVVGANAMADFVIHAPVKFGVDTTLQIKFAMVRASGSGSVTVQASANVNVLYRILDEGSEI